jgi:hypothetical protein
VDYTNRFLSATIGASATSQVHLRILECAFHIRKGPMECSQGLRLDGPSIGVYIRVRGASRFDGNLYLVNLSFLSTI